MSWSRPITTENTSETEVTIFTATKADGETEAADPQILKR